MNLIIKELEKNKQFVELVKNINNKKSPIAISGLSAMGESNLISAINEYINRPILLITYNEIIAEKLVKDISFFTQNVTYLPKKEIITYDYIAESKNLPYERIEALNKIYKNKNIIIVTSIEAAIQKMISKKALYKNTLNFKIGDKCDLEEIKQKLINLGYQRFDLIDGRGEFSVRGDIIDISVSDKQGIRIELWGDEIDSIRLFNIVSQRSVEEKKEAEIFPAHEYVLEKDIANVVNSIKEKVYSENIINKIENDIEIIENGNYISKIDRYFDSFYNNQETILDYISNDYIVLIDEVKKIEQRTENIAVDNENTIQALIEKQRIIPDSLKSYLDFNLIQEKLDNNQTIYLDKLDAFYKSGIEQFAFKYKELNYFKSEIGLFIDDIKNFKKENKRIYIVVDAKEKAEKVQKLLKENEIESIFIEDLEQTIINKDLNSVIITLGSLTSGFYSLDLNQIVISASDIIESSRKTKRKATESFKQGEKIVFADLKVGDYVVHRKYGIGVYVGVNTLKADGITKDYIKIKYYGDDILYIPTNSLDEIRKYIGSEESELKLNKLGNKDWEKTKAKVKNNLRAVAKELIELYAKREKAKGFAFSKDNDWQRQFEDSFEYVETDDQLRCIEEVKKDMENEKPMDRLLCGDVGYGKTEVAIRAAFKAVMDQKQVVYLAPTTVLAKQQYDTFKSRMKDFPIKVELLNRFRTTKDQNRIIKQLKLGEIDIVIRNS